MTVSLIVGGMAVYLLNLVMEVWPLCLSDILKKVITSICIITNKRHGHCLSTSEGVIVSVPQCV